MSPGNKRKGRRELLEMAGHVVEKEEVGKTKLVTTCLAWSKRLKNSAVSRKT